MRVFTERTAFALLFSNVGRRCPSALHVRTNVVGIVHAQSQQEVIEDQE